MESKKRTTVKALSYRGLVTIILAVISWVFTTDFGQTTVITAVYAVLATVGYYGHERIWIRISWETHSSSEHRVLWIPGRYLSSIGAIVRGESSRF